MINSLPTGKYFMLFCPLLIFFKINFMENLFQEYHLCQTAWIQIVCKSYQQTTLLTLKAPRKMHLKMASAEVVCCK